MEESLAFSLFHPINNLLSSLMAKPLVRLMCHWFFGCRKVYIVRRVPLDDWQDREKSSNSSRRRREQRKRRFAQLRTSVSVYANVFLWLHRIPSCRFLTAATAVGNRMPRVPVFVHVYCEEQKTSRDAEKERKKEQTNVRTNEIFSKLLNALL